MEILTFIGNNWVEWLFSVAFAVLAFAWKMLYSKLKEQQEKNDAIAEGVQSLLRESIVTNYNRYSSKGYCPIYAKESIKKVYHAYSDLHGNDVATGLYKELLELPTEKKEGKTDE